jgi:hypothetical protein
LIGVTWRNCRTDKLKCGRIDMDFDECRIITLAGAKALVPYGEKDATGDGGKAGESEINGGLSLALVINFSRTRPEKWGRPLERRGILRESAFPKKDFFVPLNQDRVAGDPAGNQRNLKFTGGGCLEKPLFDSVLPGKGGMASIAPKIAGEKGAGIKNYTAEDEGERGLFQKSLDGGCWYAPDQISPPNYGQSDQKRDADLRTKGMGNSFASEAGGCGGEQDNDCQRSQALSEFWPENNQHKSPVKAHSEQGTKNATNAYPVAKFGIA